MSLLDLLPPMAAPAPMAPPRPKGRWTHLFDPSRCNAEDFLSGLSNHLAQDDLLEAARELFVWRHPQFLGVRQGFQKAHHIRPENGCFGLWVLGVLGASGWVVLEWFGTSPTAMLRTLLATAPPWVWEEHLALLRVPQEILCIFRADGLVFQNFPRVNLEWLPPVMRCGLAVYGPVQVTGFPFHLQCHGPVHLFRVGGIESLSDLDSPGYSIRIDELPDLRELKVAPGSAWQVTSCPALKEVIGHLEGDLLLRDLSALKSLAIVTSDLPGRAPNLTIEDCRNLQRIDWPKAPRRWVRDLAISDCPRLQAIPIQLGVVGERRGTWRPITGQAPLSIPFPPEPE